MTATPIPRTLALTYYGDLDVSVIDELPAGRQPIETGCRANGRATGRRVRLVREEVADGRQAFVVCAAIDEANRARGQGRREGGRSTCDAGLPRAAHRAAARTDAPRREGGAHGGVPRGRGGRPHRDDRHRGRRRRAQRHRDARRERRAVRARAAAPAARPDRPRARTVRTASCSTRAGPTTATRAPGWTRWCGRRDGFELADEDLRLRGEGTLFNVQQSGMPDLKLARLADDAALVKRARARAFAVIDADEELDGHPELVALLRDDVLGRGDRMAVPQLIDRAGHEGHRGVGARRPAGPGARRNPAAGRPGPRGPVLVASAPAVGGAAVLDLFAGTGAVGIEALSRGAPRGRCSSTPRRTAVRAIRENLGRTKLADRADVVRKDVGRAALAARTGRSTWSSWTRPTRSPAPRWTAVLADLAGRQARRRGRPRWSSPGRSRVPRL